MFSDVKLIVFSVLGIVAATGIGIAVLKYQGAIKDAEILRINNEKLLISYQEQGRTIAQMTAKIEEWKQHQDKILQDIDENNQRAKRAREDVKRVEKIFAKHDFENLASQKPQLIEGVINRASSQGMATIECSSSEKGC